MGDQQILLRYWRHHNRRLFCIAAEFAKPFDRPDIEPVNGLVHLWPRRSEKLERLRFEDGGPLTDCLTGQELALVSSLLRNWQGDISFPLLQLEWQEPPLPGAAMNTVHRIICRFGYRDCQTGKALDLRDLRILPKIKAVGYLFDRAFEVQPALWGDPPRPLWEVARL